MKPLSKLSAWLVAAALLAPALAAAEYPDKPIRLVVASAAGSVADILGRVYAERLKQQVGQPVVVDNRPGATGAIGADAVAKAPADGYTVLLHSSALAINPWIARQPFDFLKDLTPVARTAETPYILTVSAQLPVRNLDEFIEYAKKNPGKLGCVFEPPPGSVQHVRSGQLRVIAHTGAAASPAFPGLEPIGKRYPAAAVVGWQAIFAPAATPKPVLDRLRLEWAKVVTAPEVEQKIRAAGFQPSKGTFEEFAAMVSSDYEKFGRIIRETGIRLE